PRSAASLAPRSVAAPTPAAKMTFKRFVEVGRPVNYGKDYDRLVAIVDVIN
ncbi:unnamed protein product, partial [Urochloa humidicola]